MSNETQSLPYRDPRTNETLLEMHQRICFEFEDIHTKESFNAWLDWMVSKGLISEHVCDGNKLH